jgi:hypothetical protein
LKARPIALSICANELCLISRIEHPRRVKSLFNSCVHYLGRTGFFCCQWTALLACCETVALGESTTMKKTIVLTFILVAASYPAIAKHHHHPHRERAATTHSRISCETVRAYVAQVGLAQAKAMAQAAGMTESEERLAAQCLEKRI